MKNYKFNLNIDFALWFIFWLCLFNTSYSQQYSEEYLNIVENDDLEYNQKSIKVDSLFKAYKESGKYAVLATDLYKYALWNYKNKNLEKALTINLTCDSLISTINSFDSYLHQRVVNNSGFFYAKKGDCYNAFKSYDRLTKLGKISSFQVKAYQRAGRHMGSHMGDFYRAANYLEKSIIESKILDDVKIYIAGCIEASINYKMIGTKKSLQRGIEILEESLEFISEKEKDDTIFIDPILKFSIYDHLGNLYNDREDYNFNKSKENYEKALHIAKKNKDSSSLSLVYNDYGHLYLHKTEKEALNLFMKALKYVSSSDLIMRSIIYENIGRYHHKNNEFEVALKNIQIACKIISPNISDNFSKLPSKEEIRSSQYKTDLLRLLILKGNIWLNFYKQNGDKDNLNQALQSYALADKLIDFIRLESNERQSKLYWRKTASNIYTNAVEACFYLNNKERAFYFIEKNKALLLLEDVSISMQRERYNLPVEVEERDLFLRSEIVQKSLYLSNSLDNDTIRNTLFNAKNDYQRFIDSVEYAYNISYHLKENIEPLNINKARKNLKKDEIFVEYILGEHKGYGFLVDSETVEFFEIKNYQNLYGNSQIFRKLIETPFTTLDKEKLFFKTSNDLYLSLFPKDILSRIKNKKIIFIPDSYLQNIPFEALVTDKDEKSYLIESNEISYAYSISFLGRNKDKKANKKNVFLGFAPVNFSNLSSLPKSEEEIKSSATLFKSDVFLNNKASKEQFLNNINEYSIVHLASHAEADDKSSPRIVFSDEDIDLEELYLTKNSANLVVLSACKTSIGELIEGEGVMSLARGFMATGAKSVVSTLWNINDDSSSEIIIDFYKNIKQGKSKSFALREAKLNYLKTHQLSERSPYYWSSFVLIGDANEIQLGNNINIITLILVGLLTGIILLIIFYKIKKNKTPKRN